MKAAIVGCGGVAQVHMQALMELEGVELAGVCDSKPEAAEAMAAAAGAPSFTALADMLAKLQPDVLHICTPHHLHVPMAELAAERGIGVFTEKPPAISLPQWERFAALEGRVPVGVCFQNRYNAETESMAALLASGRAGKPLGGRAFVTWRRDAAYYTGSDWRGDIATEGGGVLMNQAIHTLDLLVGFLGRPTQVEATMTNHHLRGVVQVEDTLEAWLSFGDMAASFYATNAYCADAPVMVEVVCEKAVLRIEDNRLTCRWQDGTRETVDFSHPDCPGKAYWGNGHRRCIADFYEALRRGTPFRNSISGVADTVLATLGIYQSARGGGVYDLPPAATGRNA